MPRDTPHGLSVLFLIENVPFSLDSRVRREANVVQKLGGSVTVICPSDGSGWHLERNGIHVYQYPKPRFGGGFLAHLSEYFASLFFHSLLSAFALVRHGFDFIHGANPPDIFWIIAIPYRLLGKRYIFDYHDLVPELFQVRFGNRFPALQPIVLWMERRGLRLADHIIATNESFRRIAIERGDRQPTDVTVVRNGPWLARDFRPIEADPSVREVAEIVVGYLGIMNPQDHLENLLEAARIIRLDRHRNDIGFVLVGSGDARADLIAMRDRMGLANVVRMLGTLPWDCVLATLRATDICVQPDLPSALNVHLAMNKLMEYMALGKPAVAYDMTETRVTGGDAVIYVAEPTPSALADAIENLADAPELRAELGRKAERRVRNVLAWEHQSRALADLYRRLCSSKATSGLHRAEP